MHSNKVAPKPSSKAMPMGWIKRRARRLAKGFQVSRGEAVEAALMDYQALRGVRPYPWSKKS